MRGGKREGSGRKPGVPNKLTAERRAEIQASGLTPLEYMLNVLRDDTLPFERRDWAAEKSAPYVHARLASTELKGEGGGPVIHRIELVAAGVNGKG